MLKSLTFSLLLISICHSAQYSKIVRDSLSNEKITDARTSIFGANYYTNDDGILYHPSGQGKITVYAPTYYPKEVSITDSVVDLRPVYSEIEAVTLKNFDLTPLFQDLIKNYKKKYYSTPSLHEITIRQKTYQNNSLSHFLVADFEFWSKSNTYIEGAKTYDSFAQLGLKKIKFYKNSSDSFEYKFANIEMKPVDFASKIFFNAHLQSIVREADKIIGTILYEDADFKKIKYTIKAKSEKYTGFILYSKSDKVITYFKMEADLKAGNPAERTTADGKPYKIATDFNSVLFDFYKKNGKYLPARTQITMRGRNLIDGKEIPVYFAQDFLFNYQKDAGQSTVQNKIDWYKKLLENIAPTADKGSQAALSKEESAFMEEK